MSNEDIQAGPAPEALTRLVRSSWRIMDGYGRLMTAVLKAQGRHRVRAQHTKPAVRLEKLIRRGRSDGSFRTDLSADWLVTSFYALLHAAAAEAEAGKIPAESVPRLLDATLQSMLARR